MKRKKRLIIIGVIAAVLLVIGASGFLVLISLRLKQRLANAVPSYPSAELYSRAVAQIQSGQYDSAEAYLQKALQQQDDPTYRSQLAVVQYRLKQYPQSIDSYRQLISARQDQAFAWNGIGNAYRDWSGAASASDVQSYASQAEAAYRSCIQVDPTYAACYSNLAQLQAGEGKASDALATLDAGISATQQPELQKIKDSLKPGS